MGIGIFIKNFVPPILYLLCIIFSLMAMTGRINYAFYLAIILLPLRNISEHIQALPFGNQYLDLLLGSVFIGWISASSKNQNSSFKQTPIIPVSLVLILYMLFSVLRGSFFLGEGLNFNIHDARVQDWKNISLMPLIFFLVLRTTSTSNNVWSLFSVMCFSMLIVAYYTVNQTFSFSSLESRGKITGTFQFLGPNEIAAFFNEYTIILMSLIYGIKKLKYKIPLLLLVTINLYCILFLYSRGAYIGLTVGMCILFAFKDKKMLIILALVLVLWQTVLPQKVIDRIKETKTESGELDESSQHRIDIWQQAIDLFKTNPVIGIGFGVFRRLGLMLGDTHNIYVKILTEQGLIGLLLFFLTIYFFMREGLILYKKGEDELSRSLGLGFFCCIFVVLVNNLFGDRWSYLEPNAFLWIFAGLVSWFNCNPRIQISSKPKPYKPFNKTNTKNTKKLRYYDI